jgi:hypothetical protein
MSPSWDRNENQILSELAGNQVERDLFGEFMPASKIKPPRPNNDEDMYQEVIRGHEHPSFPIDPEDPKAPFAAALLQQVRDSLQSSTLQFFTSTGSPLDWHLGVDGFFQDKGVRVTIDLKTSQKTDGKADLIMNVPSTSLDPIGRPKEFTEHVNDLARRVVQKFKIRARGV